ncbi:MAG: Rrf2 family transcriptional regulator [Phenylobacterium sp.]|jgi:Rrf2 family protein|uniref:RrF2 family transcriptional regulator n=1 Tax=Phenylobacterium sp. TaxID=1871053 RepID=UPI002A36EF8A|nr:Rrf2 family transcriptional regulator [Phenylobacterium sp.]MDX9998957.1 Rrf2 family transcriptional regulator [Phenylobacterium sp.]
MLSQRARYALRALVHLAGRTDSRPAAIADIAKAADAPRKFLEAILLELKRHHLLVSTRGRAGGYSLARSPAEINFADVIRALDGPLALAPCASKTAYRPCETCPTVEGCPIHPALVKARDAVAEVLEGWTLEKAAADPARALQGL